MQFQIEGNWGDIIVGFTVGLFAERLGRWAFAKWWPLLILPFMAGCLTCPPAEPVTEVHGIPMEVLEQASRQAKSEQMPVLTAVATLVQAGFFSTFTWTEPDSGSTVVNYRVEMDWTQNEYEYLYVLNSNKRNLRVRVAGVDIQSIQGPWSAHSDTAFVEDVQ